MGLQSRSTIKVTCSRMRMVLIARFIKDLDHFFNLAVLQYFAEPPNHRGTDNAMTFTVEADIHHYRLVIPRFSWSHDLYALIGTKVTTDDHVRENRDGIPVGTSSAASISQLHCTCDGLFDDVDAQDDGIEL